MPLSIERLQLALENAVHGMELWRDELALNTETAEGIKEDIEIVRRLALSLDLLKGAGIE